MTSFQRSLQRSLNERGSIVNIIEGDNLKLSREVLSAKREQLVVEHCKEYRPQAARELTDAEENKLFQGVEFGTSNPTNLQCTLRWIIETFLRFKKLFEFALSVFVHLSFHSDVFINQACSVKMAGYWPRPGAHGLLPCPFFHFYGPRRNAKKELGQYPET